jgi:hypothetical protein
VLNAVYATNVFAYSMSVTNLFATNAVITNLTANGVLITNVSAVNFATYTSNKLSPVVVINPTIPTQSGGIGAVPSFGWYYTNTTANNMMFSVSGTNFQVFVNTNLWATNAINATAILQPNEFINIVTNGTTGPKVALISYKAF